MSKGTTREKELERLVELEARKIQNQQPEKSYDEIVRALRKLHGLPPEGKKLTLEDIFKD